MRGIYSGLGVTNSGIKHWRDRYWNNLFSDRHSMSLTEIKDISMHFRYIIRCLDCLSVHINMCLD